MLYCKTMKRWPLFICLLQKYIYFALNASSYTPTAIHNSPRPEVIFYENIDRLLDIQHGHVILFVDVFSLLIKSNITFKFCWHQFWIELEHCWCNQYLRKQLFLVSKIQKQICMNIIKKGFIKPTDPKEHIQIPTTIVIYLKIAISISKIK